jgi:hypothetical protein
MWRDIPNKNNVIRPQVFEVVCAPRDGSGSASAALHLGRTACYVPKASILRWAATRTSPSPAAGEVKREGTSPM